MLDTNVPENEVPKIKRPEVTEREKELLAQPMITSFMIHIPVDGGPVIGDTTVQGVKVERRATIDDMFRGTSDLMSQLQAMRASTVLTGMIAGAQKQSQNPAAKIIKPGQV